MRQRTVLIFVVVFVGLALLVFSQLRVTPFSVSGLLESDEIRVGSRVGGRVAKVSAVEGQRVAKGDLLLELEPFALLEDKAAAAAEARALESELEKLRAGNRPEEIAQAKARRDQAAAHLAKLEAGPRKQEIATAAALFHLAQAELELVEFENKRTRELFASNVKSQEDLDRSTTQLKSARAFAESRKEELALLEEGTRKEDLDEARARLAEADEAWKLLAKGPREEDIHKAEAAVLGARAQLDAIERKLEELRVVAPGNGVIEAVDLQPGDLVAAGAPVLSILDTSRLWVRAYVPEAKLGVQLGQQVQVKVDAWPDATFRGQITFVARQAEFMPSNAQTPEERSKQVFRIKVTLEEGLDKLRPGMAADIDFEPMRPSSSNGGASRP